MNCNVALFLIISFLRMIFRDVVESLRASGPPGGAMTFNTDAQRKGALYLRHYKRADEAMKES